MQPWPPCHHQEVLGWEAQRQTLLGLPTEGIGIKFHWFSPLKVLVLNFIGFQFVHMLFIQISINFVIDTTFG
jgi:hypothetical protein